VMKDGRIEREDVIGQPFEEDLKAFKHSGLGRALLAANAGASDSLDGLLAPTDQEALRRVLARVSG